MWSEDEEHKMLDEIVSRYVGKQPGAACQDNGHSELSLRVSRLEGAVKALADILITHMCGVHGE